MTLLESALAGINRGWKLFPVEPRGKRPLTQHGFKDASRVEIHIRAWWAKWPDANIGLATGPSSVDVLDADGPEGRAELERLAALYPSLHGNPRVETGGGGIHVYYPGGTLGTTTRRLPGIDTRGEGGYVLLPPSIHPSSNPYLWALDGPFGPLEPELAAFFTGRAQVAPLDGPPAQVPPGVGRTLLEQAGVPLIAIVEGQRDDRLAHIGLSLRARGMEHGGIRNTLSIANALLCLPPLPEAQVNKIARSVAGYAVAEGYKVTDDPFDSKVREAKAKAERTIEAARAAEAKAIAIAEAAKARNDAKAAEEIKAREVTSDEDLAREFIKVETGVPITKIVQTGRDSKSYYIHLEGDSEPIHIGNSLVSQKLVGEAWMGHRQSAAFVRIKPKKWEVVRDALLRLVVVQDVAETSRENQTLGWIAELYSATRDGQRNLEIRSEEVISKRLSYIEAGHFLFTGSALGGHLSSRGMHLTLPEIAIRLSEVGAEPKVVSVGSRETRVQARYWSVEISTLMGDS